jgi:hypothetical protein
VKPKCKPETLSPRRLARLCPITDLIISSPLTGFMFQPSVLTGGEVVQPRYDYHKISVIREIRGYIFENFFSFPKTNEIASEIIVWNI